MVGLTGSRATLGVKVKLEVAECWVGGLVVVLDRDAFAVWLACPDGSFTRDEVTFGPDPDGLGMVVSVAGRVANSVLAPHDVARLMAAVHRELPLGDVGSASKAVRTVTSARVHREW